MSASRIVRGNRSIKKWVKVTPLKIPHPRSLIVHHVGARSMVHELTWHLLEHWKESSVVLWVLRFIENDFFVVKINSVAHHGLRLPLIIVSVCKIGFKRAQAVEQVLLVPYERNIRWFPFFVRCCDGWRCCTVSKDIFQCASGVRLLREIGQRTEQAGNGVVESPHELNISLVVFFASTMVEEKEI